MHINGINIEDFKAKLLEKPLITENIDVDYLKSVGGTTLILFNQEYGTKKLELVLEITADNRNEAYVLKSKLLKELSGISNIVLTDGFIYQSILGKVDIEVIVSNIIQIKLEFNCIQCGQLQEITLLTSGIIKNEGTMASDCSISFTSSTTISNFWFQLNTTVVYIDELTAGQTFVIDGLNKIVKNETNNAINETDLIDFPKLQSGVNTLTLSNNVTVNIRYYPVFI